MKDDFENIDDVFFKNLEMKGGFKTPTKYFDQSTANILNKINAEPNFAVNNNEGGFSVPNNYFETNKTEILSKIISPKAKKINLYSASNWQFISGIAALFIAIFSIFIFLNKKETGNLSANLNKVSDAEMIEYLATNDVKVEWINELNSEVKPISKKEENNKEIEQYLLDHADEQALLDEL